MDQSLPRNQPVYVIQSIQQGRKSTEQAFPVLHFFSVCPSVRPSVRPSLSLSFSHLTYDVFWCGFVPKLSCKVVRKKLFEGPKRVPHVGPDALSLGGSGSVPCLVRQDTANARVDMGFTSSYYVHRFRKTCC